MHGLYGGMKPSGSRQVLCREAVLVNLDSSMSRTVARQPAMGAGEGRTNL